MASIVHRWYWLLVRPFRWRETGGGKVARLDVDGRGMIKARWQKRARAC